jgi:hypothetical protein
MSFELPWWDSYIERLTHFVLNSPSCWICKMSTWNK